MSSLVKRSDGAISNGVGPNKTRPDRVLLRLASAATAYAISPKPKERRREILMGAARAFAHGGYDATNMDQIARECGLAKGHIYHYFRSKEEIFTEIRIDAVSRLIERLAAIAPAAANDPELALRKAISAVIARIFEEEERYELRTARPRFAQPGESKAHSNLGPPLRADVREYCAQWNRQGSFRRGRSETHDLRDLARCLYRRQLVSRRRQMETAMDCRAGY